MSSERPETRIPIFDYSGSFGGDKDAAAKVRDELLKPALKQANADVIVDFVDVEFVTQSFVHALLCAIVRKQPSALERLRFDNCSESVREIIEIVVQYSQ